jgi:hypothetical protein
MKGRSQFGTTETPTAGAEKVRAISEYAGVSDLPRKIGLRRGGYDQACSIGCARLRKRPCLLGTDCPLRIASTRGVRKSFPTLGLAYQKTQS